MTAFREPDYAFAQKSAYNLLKSLSISSLPISIQEVIDSIPGLHTQEYEQFANDSNCSEDEVCRLLQSDDGALWYNATDNEYCIFYNSKINSKERIRFTLAHELGHYILQHNEESGETIVSRYLLPSDKYRVYEKEANYFAKRFLAPIPVIDGFLSYNDYHIDPRDIETLFNVSYSVSNYIFGDLKRRIQYGIAAYRTDLTNQFDQFNFIVSSTYTCNNCHTLIPKKADFCPICNKPVKHDYLNYLYLDKKWRNKVMYYETPCNLDSNGKATICPVCNNEEVANGPICSICGTYLINKCSGCSITDSFIDDFTSKCLHASNGCGTLLRSNARYCIQCGCMSTFYLQNILPDYTEEYKAASDSKLKAI